MTLTPYAIAVAGALATWVAADEITDRLRLRRIRRILDKWEPQTPPARRPTRRGGVRNTAKRAMPQGGQTFPAGELRSATRARAAGEPVRRRTPYSWGSDLELLHHLTLDELAQAQATLDEIRTLPETREPR